VTANLAFDPSKEAPIHGLLGHYSTMRLARLVGDNIVAEVDLGRVYINHGAEERT
jgi:hypothetical protein